MCLVYKHQQSAVLTQKPPNSNEHLIDSNQRGGGGQLNLPSQYASPTHRDAVLAGINFFQYDELSTCYAMN